MWLADHDLDGDGKSQITVYSGRGVLSESQGPVWMIGTGELRYQLCGLVLESSHANDISGSLYVYMCIVEIKSELNSTQPNTTHSTNTTSSMRGTITSVSYRQNLSVAMLRRPLKHQHLTDLCICSHIINHLRHLRCPLLPTLDTTILASLRVSSLRGRCL